METTGGTNQLGKRPSAKKDNYGGLRGVVLEGGTTTTGGRPVLAAWAGKAMARTANTRNAPMVFREADVFIAGSRYGIGG